MAILVVGGAGYIGSHVLKELARSGLASVCLDDLSSGHALAVRDAPLIVADMADRAALQKAVESFAVDCVIHFAAKCSVDESVRNPQLYYEHNLRRPLLMVKTLLACGVRQFVFSSSAAVYGEPEQVPIMEHHPTRPLSPYGRTKLFFEQVLEDFRLAYGLRYVSLRYFNAAGADPDGDLGEDHRPETHLIPKVLLMAMRPGGTAEIYGTDYPTRDGTCLRDFVHVTDLAQGHVLAVKALAAGLDRGTYNLGSGTGGTVKEVIETARRVCGVDLPVREAPRREGDPAMLVASRQKAGQDLGWEPRLSDMETVVRTSYEWLRAHPGGYSESRGDPAAEADSGKSRVALGPLS